MAAPGSIPPRDPSGKSVGELVSDVTERTSTLIREEIELAKTEISEKVTQLVKGSVVGIVAGAFAFLALILFMHGLAWLLNDLFFDDNFWAGFFVEGLIFVLIAAGAGYFAYRSVQAGSPPVPEQAIEEAKLTRAVLEGETSEPASSTPGVGTATGGGPGGGSS